MMLRAALLIALLVVPASAKPLKFPKKFLWGTAIAGFQSDMGLGTPNDTNTDWWVWVRDPANIGHGVSGDLPENGPGFSKLYKSDARLAHEKLHNNALRLSLEWSRIFPTSTAAVDISGGITPATLAALDALADQSAVATYRTILKALRAKKLTPMVTLNHFTLPLWLHDPIAVHAALAGVEQFNGPLPSGLSRAGWLDPAIVDEFAKYAAYAGWKFGDLVDLWCTINEPVVLLVNGFLNVGGVGGFFPPGAVSFAAVPRMIPNLVAAHARAYDALHETDTIDANGDGVAVAAGVVHNMSAFHPADPNNPRDVAGTAHADYLVNQLLLRAITTGAFDANLDGDTDDPGEQRADLAGRSDFIGVNYYLRSVITGLPGSVTSFVPLFDFLPTVTYQGAHTTGPMCPSECTDFGWEIYPAGLREVLTFVGTLGLPVYITENGIADAADTKRGQYIYDHLATLQGVSAGGVADVRGYFHWSLTDNFEWSSGYYPRFGLFAYDPSGKRTLRKSAKVYRSIAAANGIPGRLTKRYGASLVRGAAARPATRVLPRERCGRSQPTLALRDKRSDRRTRCFR